MIRVKDRPRYRVSASEYQYVPDPPDDSGEIPDGAEAVTVSGDTVTVGGETVYAYS